MIGKHASGNVDLYIIKHCYDVDGGFGDAVAQETVVGTAMATEEQIKAYIEKWNKPRIYDKPYCALYDHSVRAEKIEVSDLDSIVPYDEDDPCYFSGEEDDDEDF